MRPRCSWALWAASPPTVSRPASSAGGRGRSRAAGPSRSSSPWETTAFSTAFSTSAARASTTSPSRCRASTRSPPAPSARATTSWVATTRDPELEGSLPSPEAGARHRRAVRRVRRRRRRARPHWQPPPGPPDPPAPVTIVGLRLRAHSRERARRQWETVLEGQASDGPEGELIYRWPDSPMRLAVEIDPARDEGPVAIELASDRAIALPDGPHPALGTVFRRVRPFPSDRGGDGRHAPAQRSPSRGRSSTRSARVRSIRQATSGSRVASGRRRRCRAARSGAPSA